MMNKGGNYVVLAVLWLHRIAYTEELMDYSL